MIGYYKKSREDIVKIIKKSPVTQDGYYVCKNFRYLNNSKGDILDKKYKYSREYFENKICFNQADIEIYLETGPNNYDIIRMKQLDDFLLNIINEDVEAHNDINEVIKGYQFTLNELIDTSIYLFNCKY